MKTARILVVRIPQWSVRAALSHANGSAAGTTEISQTPAAVLKGGIVVSVSSAAWQLGIKPGQRRRSAQELCPDIQLFPNDTVRDDRAFLPVLRVLEEHIPGVHPIRAGMAALPARGVRRYYGSEDRAADILLQALAQQGFSDTHIGIADNLFAAEAASHQAAKAHRVPPGEDAGFLAPLPITALNTPQISSLLEELGIHTLGDFAALSASGVSERWGLTGARLHAWASGKDYRLLQPQQLAKELSATVVFDTPLVVADHVVAAAKTAAADTAQKLKQDLLVCTEIQIDLRNQGKIISSKNWGNPGGFNASDMLGRLHWQLHLLAKTVADEEADQGITEITITPLRTESAQNHQSGLFGQGPDARLQHVLSRVQDLLGAGAVITPKISGGRLLNQRQQATSWAESAPPLKDPALPWPGHLTQPLPGMVYPKPLPVELLGNNGTQPDITPRGALTAEPKLINQVAIIAWSAPWPIQERSWEKSQTTPSYRLQIIDSSHTAWLVLYSSARWWLEAQYD